MALTIHRCFPCMRTWHVSASTVPVLNATPCSPVGMDELFGVSSCGIIQYYSNVASIQCSVLYLRNVGTNLLHDSITRMIVLRIFAAVKTLRSRENFVLLFVALKSHVFYLHIVRFCTSEECANSFLVESAFRVSRFSLSVWLQFYVGLLTAFSVDMC